MRGGAPTSPAPPQAAAGRKHGDGLIGQYRFLLPVDVSLLTQRRVAAPFGLEGGEAGAMGRNQRIQPITVPAPAHRNSMSSCR
ncbi:MAG TPA: hydantoinase B/oxoprolinase family protein [Fibrobacteria bacterium]|nr:hydantoinase B/oxoprolinase family protein [Fibrobacteria bacterium]